MVQKQYLDCPAVFGMALFSSTIPPVTMIGYICWQIYDFILRNARISDESFEKSYYQARKQGDGDCKSPKNRGRTFLDCGLQIRRNAWREHPMRL